MHLIRPYTECFAVQPGMVFALSHVYQVSSDIRCDDKYRTGLPAATHALALSYSLVVGSVMSGYLLSIFGRILPRRSHGRKAGALRGIDIPVPVRRYLYRIPGFRL